MTENRNAIKPCDEPGEASVEDGFVVLDGPDGVAVTMTPEAAALTAESLRLAALQAQAAKPTGLSSEGEHDENHAP